MGEEVADPQSDAISPSYGDLASGGIDRKGSSSGQILTGRNFDDRLSGEDPVTAGEIHGKPPLLACKLECGVLGKRRFLQQNQ